MSADAALQSGALTLLPERAIVAAADRTLFVADLHLGKAAAFRAAGAPAPFGASEETLRRLASLVDRVAAERLVVLGDFVHARASMTEGLVRSLAEWRRARAKLECLIVLGNHDRRAAHLYGSCGFDVADEPSVIGAFACRHHPLKDDARKSGPITLAGHVHPVARISGRGRDLLRLPCFVIDSRQIVLPAFGEFVGGSLVRAGESRRLVLAAPHRLIELAAPRPPRHGP